MFQELEKLEKEEVKNSLSSEDENNIGNTHLKLANLIQMEEISRIQKLRARQVHEGDRNKKLFL